MSQQQQPRERMLRRIQLVLHPGTHHIGTAIRRRVIHHDQLELRTALRSDALQCGRDARAVIEQADDHRGSGLQAVAPVEQLRTRRAGPVLSEGPQGGSVVEGTQI